jgi:hypothetical protein
MLTARNAMFSFAMWLGVLQSILPVQHETMPGGANLVSIAQLVGFASVLGSLTVLVYRLGVWRQEMENTKHNVGAEVRAHRGESATNFDRLERRLEAIDHLITLAAEQQGTIMRWQERAERRLARLEALKVITDAIQ